MSACWHKWLRIEELERQLIEQDRVLIEENTEPYDGKRKYQEKGEEADLVTKKRCTTTLEKEMPPEVLEALKVVARFFNK